MEPQQQPLDTILQQRWVLRVLDLLAAVTILAALMVIYIAFTGYRTITFNGLPAGATVTLNGHHVTTASVTVLPGSYNVLVLSPTTAPYTGTANVGWFSDLSYTPKLSQRPIDTVASSLLGATPETSFAPQMDQLQWFESRTWAVGILSPTSTVLAIHYNAAQKQWVIAYCGDPAYPNNVSVLPTDVANYVQSLQNVRSQ